MRTKIALLSSIVALLFAVPSLAETVAPTAPAPVSTFSVTSAVASLPIVGETVAANVTGAALQVTANPNNNVVVTNVNVLSGSVQVYMGGVAESFMLDKVTPKNWLSSGWHFKLTADEAMGVSEYDAQHIAVMLGTRFTVLMPGTSKFALVGGVHYINAAGIAGHVMVTLGPSISW